MNCKGYNHAKYENALMVVSDSWYQIDWQPAQQSRIQIQMSLLFRDHT